MNAPCFAPAQLRLLRLLARGPEDITGIARALELHSKTARDVMRRLRDRGLARRSAGLYWITETGRETLADGGVSRIDRSRLHHRFSKQEEAQRAQLMARTLDLARQRGLDEPATEYLLRLTFPDGMTEAEIARYLGTSRQAVNQVLLRALAKLRKNRALREHARD